MGNIIRISDINDPAIEIFHSLTEAQLRQSMEYERGVFIAESPKVIKVALQNGYEPISLLCEEKHINGDAAEIISGIPDMPVYTSSREILREITGYTLTRGVLCAMKRKELPDIKSFRDAQLLCVIQSVCDTTNIGAIFRSAAALGVDGVVLSSDTCDPLNRRSIRVSMGNVFSVPWTICENPVEALHDIGFKVAALALKDNSLSLADPILKKEQKLGVIFGTEGDGLNDDIVNNADYVVKIPMYHNVDSLNVAAAAAVTFWELRVRPLNH